jgi:outer membrane protein assembly factor BamB
MALEAGTGETRWQHAYEAPLPKNPVFDFWNTSAGPGPYASPLLADGRLFALGVGGLLHVLDAKTGAMVWKKDLVAELRPPDFRATAASPIAYGENVILPVGGRGQGLVAFDGATGEVAWKSQDFQDAPASPVLIDVGGQEQLVVFGREQVAGVNPGNGELYWNHPHATQFGLNISTPVWGEDGILILSSAYDGGSRALRLTREGGETTVEELWFNNRMRVHFGNMVRFGGLVIVTSGDFGPAFFTAVDAETGEEAWRERSLARSHMVYAGGRLVIVDEDGEIALATPSETGLDIHARTQVLKENAWTPPTLVGSRLYLRDRQSVMALELGPVD